MGLNKNCFTCNGSGTNVSKSVQAAELFL